ncbi:ABC transporter substrate-binding protein [Clostridium beijerinckii]|uniref:ABC transporter substrate-binding protein n=1 Tax=Clostridium beijerinckii TaxID=1520 RepID=A0A0B5QN77_CLOBE|nr:extracellular solute-binding protein [Clostridium beijerinckii]AJG98273.1 ABC transporter substrate-binding protein [Clostridium beijerinckii]
MKFKKIIGAVVTGIMAFSLMACGSTSSSSGTASSKGKDDKTITIWAWDETFNVKAANEAKEIYLKDHPDVNINVVSMARPDVIQKLNTGLSSGTIEGLPNIVLIEDTNSAGYLQSYPDQFKDLSSKVDKNKFMDFKLSCMTEGNKLYGVPFDSGVAVLFYRTDLLEQAGYKKEDMNNITWEKYIEIGKAVKAKTGKYMLALDPSNLGIFDTMLQSAGSWYTKEDGKTVDIANNTALKDAISIYKQFVDSGIVKLVNGSEATRAAFQKGESISVPTGCWMSSTILKSEDQKGKWAIAPIPRMGANPKSVNASNNGGAGWYVLDKVGDSDLATDFLASTFGSSNELMNQLVPDINLVSTLKSASSSENYSKPVEFYGNQEIFKDFAEWSNKIPAVNYGSQSAKIRDIFQEGVQAIVVNNADVDETLKNIQTRAEVAIAQ